MDYLSLIKSLRSEALEGIQYKRMRSPFNVFAFIAMLPYIISAFLSFVGFYVLVFIYNGVAAAADYLENWVDRKKKDLHPATEAVLYFITTPFIFLCQCFLSLFSIFFYFSWFIIQMVCFIATLGGTRWQPFLYHSKFGEDAPVFCASTKHGAAHTFAVITFSFLCFNSLLLLILMLVDNLKTAATISEMYTVFAAIATLFELIAVPLMFKKKFGMTAEEFNEYEMASYYEAASGYYDAQNANYYEAPQQNNYYEAPQAASYYAPQQPAAPAAPAAPTAPAAAPQDDDFLPEL